MSDFERTISAVLSRLSSGANELPLWQAKAMQHWFNVFVTITQSHHDHEEQVSRGVLQCEVQPALQSPGAFLSLSSACM